MSLSRLLPQRVSSLGGKSLSVSLDNPYWGNPNHAGIGPVGTAKELHLRGETKNP